MRNMHDYPAEIERLAIGLAANGDELSEVRGRIKDAEMEATSAAIDARGESNKPLHTNDKARELAVWKSLKGSPSYQQDLASERILERRKAELTAQCERLRREYQIALIDYEAGRPGSRVAA